ncbi:MAG: radical SAM protein [Syntrophobacteraceae bacterium]
MILLVNPPVVKPSEPPPGIARLHGALSAAGVKCSALDANIEAFAHLLEKPVSGSDRWTLRAARNRDGNLDAIRSTRGYLDLDRYKRLVSDINRLIEKADCGPDGPDRLSLANHTRGDLSPVRSADLLRAAEEYVKNPFYDYFSRRLAAVLERDAPEIVGFSLNYLSQALTAFSMMGYVRAHAPRVKIVLGGGLVTSWARNPHWKNPFGGLADHIVDGPGERALLALAGKDANGAAPRPVYGPFPLRDYFAPGPILPYSASSGCYWNRCSFCPETAEGTRYDPIGPAAAATEAGELVREVRPALVHFLDSALSPALLRELAQNPPGAPWYGFVRVTRRLADADFCRGLRASGCVMLKLGLESGDQGVIDAEGKGIDLGVASRALVSLKAAGIGTYVYLLFGTPSETEKEARNTLDFTVRHSEYIDFLNLAVFNMPVNSPDARRFGTGPHYGGDLSLYTGFAHPAGWDRARVRHFLDREFKRHPAIAPIIAGDPPFFTSNHAPFFCRSFAPGSRRG